MDGWIDVNERLDWNGLIDTRNGMAWIWMTDIWRFATLYGYDRWTKKISCGLREDFDWYSLRDVCVCLGRVLCVCRCDVFEYCCVL
jgi:hypothetical protein